MTIPLSVVSGMPRNSPVTQLNNIADVEFPIAPLIDFHMTHSCPMPNRNRHKNAIVPQIGSIRELIANVDGRISVINLSGLYPLSL
jgi:hypothetical protein